MVWAKLSRTQFETQVAPYTKQDDFLIEISSFEKLQWRGCGTWSFGDYRTANLFHCLHQNLRTLLWSAVSQGGSAGSPRSGARIENRTPELNRGWPPQGAWGRTFPCY